MSNTSGVTGLEVCKRNLKTIQKRYVEQGAKALEAWGRKTMDDSKNNYCPVDTGLMKGTGNIQMIRGANRIEVILFYDTEYAPTVHEKAGMYHPVGQSGFLRIPFNNHAPELLQTVAQYLKAVGI